MVPLSDRTFCWSVALGAWALDQATKALITAYLQAGESIPIIPGLFDLTLVTNTGGIFGILRDLDGPLKKVTFTLIPVAAISLMIWYGSKLPAGRRWPRIALGLILGGAAGNLQDRIALGHVIDFLDAYVGRHHWPTFNLADSGICVGVTMLLVESFLLQRAGDGAATPPPL